MADIAFMKTAAEQQLAAEWQQARGLLPGPAALREKAFERFQNEGLPHRRIEEWKYTDLRALMREALPPAAVPDAAAKARARQAGATLASLDARRIVFVDGTFTPELSDLAALEPGLAIRSMAQSLATGDPLVVEHLGSVVPTDDVAVALNTAFMGDGAVIHVAAGATLARPLHLVFVNAGNTPGSVFVRSLVVIEGGARVMVMESHQGGRGYQVNAATELRVGEGAHVDHVKITSEEAGALHIWSLMADIGAGSRFNEFLFTSAGAVLRNQLFVRFAGEGTLAGIRGASLLKGSQHADTSLLVDHAVAGCTSRELFKSVLDDEARGIFQGKIVVQRNAQKTDAKMASHALLLSQNAEADNKPELEIFADDVQCGHGATSGALDEELLFYLRARGIPFKEAQSLLIQAFLGEAIEGIEHAGLRDALMDQVVAWLERRG